MFAHYIAHLASWYDLNDCRRHFTDLVPVRARHSPLLLSAILAFSAASKRHSDNDEALLEKAAFYHLESVQILLQITSHDNTEEVTSNGEVLAAICLLRSYEIIARQLVHALGNPMMHTYQLSIRETELAKSPSRLLFPAIQSSDQVALRSGSRGILESSQRRYHCRVDRKASSND